jgi:Tfp pilus assembly protein PilV
VRSPKTTVSAGGEAGFSILEVAIALVILLTVLVSVSSLLVTAFKVGANSRYRQVATEVATSTLDSEVQTGSTALVAHVGDSALSTVTSSGQQYIQELEVSPYTPGSSACASPGTGSAMLKITVWVTWANVTSGTTWWISGSSGSTGMLVEETTLLALPTTAFNANDGTLLVDVTNAAGNGVQGITVTATSGSTTLSAVTTGSGCALFANVTPASNWVITGTKAGYIDSLDDWSTSTNSASPVTSPTETVVSGNVLTVALTYDQEATVSPTYSVPAVNGVQPSTPSGITAMPVTFYTSYSSLSPPNGYVAASPGLVFPFTSTPSYYVVAGSCGAESSPAGANVTGAQTDGQPVTLTPGCTAAPAFALTPVEVVVTHNGTPVANASVSAAVKNTDSNCSTGTLAMPTLGLGTTCNPTGSLYPCTYQLAAHRVRRSPHGKQPVDAILVSCMFGCHSTATGVSSSANPSTTGSSVTLTATVSCTSGFGCSTPTGTVAFTSNGTTISGCSAVTVNGSGVATCTTSALATGADAISAAYTATGSFSNSTGALTQTVSAISTATSVTASQNPANLGSSVILTATVTPASSGPATGSVTFTANGAAIAACASAVTVGSSGTATCTTSALSIGSDVISAVYSPTGNFAASTGTLTEVVNLGSTSPYLLSGLPYGVWLLTVTYGGNTATTTVTITGTSEVVITVAD